MEQQKSYQKSYFDLCKECETLMVKIAKENEKLINDEKDDEEKEKDKDKDGDSINNLKEIKDNIGKLINKKNEISIAIIGQMRKGKITENLSLRKGYFHFKRRRNCASLYRVKEELESNIHEVKDKFTANNFEILEFILQRVYEKENENGGYGSYVDKISEEKERFIMDIKERALIYPSSYKAENYENSFEVIKVNCIILENGELYLGYKYDKNTHRFDDTTLLPLFIKEYNNELKDNIAKEIKCFRREVDRLEKEINDIKTKGQNLYMLYELNKGNTAQ